MYFLSNLRARDTQGSLIDGHLNREGFEMIAVMVNDD